jgi:hypothetical protein
MNRFAAFSIGIAFTVVTGSAVNYVNAAGDSTIKACANKKTGAMRYIKKGKCKKTESVLLWNRQGLQGLQGIQGLQGLQGIPGSSAPANGRQQIHVFDSAGRDFGVPISIDNANTAKIFYDGGIWTFSSSPTSNISGDRSLINKHMYWDNGCTQPFFSTPGGTNALSNARTFTEDSVNGPRTYYKPTGSPFSGSSLSTWYTTVSYGSPIGCKLSTVIEAYYSGYTRDAKSPSIFYTSVVKVNPPPYLAPFSLVLK